MQKNDRPKSQSNSPEGMIDLIDDAVSEIVEDVSELVNAKIELAKLDAIEVFAGLMSNIVLTFMGMIAFGCLLISLALFFGEFLGQRSIGFLIIGFTFVGILTFLALFKPDLLRDSFLKILWREVNRKKTTQGT